MADTARDEIRQLAGSIRTLERQLEVMLAKRRVELNYEMHDGIVHFEHVVIAKHRLLKARLVELRLRRTASHDSYRAGDLCAHYSGVATRPVCRRISDGVLPGIWDPARAPGATTWRSTASSSATSTRSRNSIAPIAPTRTVYSRMFGRSGRVPSSTGARSSMRDVYWESTRAMAASWTTVTAMPTGTSSSIFARRRDRPIQANESPSSASEAAPPPRLALICKIGKCGAFHPYLRPIDSLPRLC